jgi:hypothetical protein
MGFAVPEELYHIGGKAAIAGQEKICIIQCAAQENKEEPCAIIRKKEKNKKRGKNGAVLLALVPTSCALLFPLFFMDAQLDVMRISIALPRCHLVDGLWWCFFSVVHYGALLKEVQGALPCGPGQCPAPDLILMGGGLRRRLWMKRWLFSPDAAFPGQGSLSWALCSLTALRRRATWKTCSSHEGSECHPMGLRWCGRMEKDGRMLAVAGNRHYSKASGIGKLKALARMRISRSLCPTADVIPGNGLQRGKTISGFCCFAGITLGGRSLFGHSMHATGKRATATSSGWYGKAAPVSW